MAPAPSGPTPMSVADRMKMQVANAAALKRLQLDPGNLARVATALNEGNSLASDPLVQDLAGLSEATIRSTYGDEGVTAQRLIRAEQENIERGRNASRTAAQVAGDTALGVGAGAVAGIGSIAALIGGGINPDIGAGITALSNGVSEGIRGFQSEELRTKKELGALRDKLDREDNAALRAREEADGAGGLMPALRQIGRDMADKGADLWNNPALAGDLGAEGIGSLASSIGIGGLLAKGSAKAILAARGITGEAATKFLASPAGAEFVSRVAKGSMTGSIALQEGAGAYTQAVTEIANMGEDELMQSSPEYVRMREAGKSHEEARNEIANEAGLIAASITGVAAVPAAGLVSGLEGRLLGSVAGRSAADAIDTAAGVSRRGIMDAAGEVAGATARETVEEGLQNASSQVATNYAIGREADPDRQLTEGVGGSLVEGAVAGGIMGASLRSHRLPIGAAQTAYDGAKAGIKAALGARDRAAEAADPNNLDNTTDAIDRLFTPVETAASGPEVASPPGSTDPAATAAPTEPAAPVEQAASTAPKEGQEPASFDPVQEIKRRSLITGQEMNDLPPEIRKMVLGEGDVVPAEASAERKNILKEVLKEVTTGTNWSKEDKAKGALWLNEQVSWIEGLESDARVQAIDNPVWNGARDAARTIKANRELKAIRDSVAELTSADLGAMPKVTAENAGSQEVQDAVNTQVSLAAVNPTGIDTGFVRSVLAQVTPEKRQVLETALVLVEEFGANQEAKEAIAQEATDRMMQAKGETRSREEVHDDIIGKAQNSDTVEAVAVDYTSLKDHITRVASAVKAGRLEDAQASLDQLRKFAQHMRYKALAARESASLNRSHNNKVYYRTWNGSRWLDGEEGNAVYIAPGSLASVRTGQFINLDMQSALKTYNSLVKIYGGSLKGKEIPIPAMPPLFNTRKINAPAKPAPAQPPEAKAPAAPGPHKTGGMSDVSLAQEEAAAAEAKRKTEEEAAAKAKADAEAAAKKKAEEEAAAAAAAVRVVLPIRTQYTAKDQKKSDKANRFIGRGSSSSSTNAYTKAWGNRANSGETRPYTAEDVIFVSAEGARNGRLSADEKELSLAVKAGATFITDTAADRDRSYNVGEREVASFLAQHGYEEVEPGVWKPVAAASNQEGDQDETGGEDTPEEILTTEKLTFPKLPKLKGEMEVSHFEQTYSVTATPAMVHEEGPLEFVYGKLKDFYRDPVKSVKELKLKYVPSEQAVRAVGSIIGYKDGSLNVVGQMINRMNGYLVKNTVSLKGTVKESPLARAAKLDGDETTKPNFKLFALVDTETGQFEPSLLEAGILAMVHWSLSTPRPPKKDLSDLARDLGVKETELTQKNVRDLQSGVSQDMAVKSLAATILKFWGARENNKRTISDTQGIAISMAGVLLRQGVGLTHQMKEVRIDQASGKPKITYIYTTGIPGLSEDKRTALRGVSYMIGDIVTGESNAPYHFDETPKADTKMSGNPIRGESKRMGEAVRNHNRIGYRRNGPVLSFMSKALGRDTWLALRGYRKISEAEKAVMNRNHLDMIEGKNNQLEWAYDGVMAHDEALAAYARANPEKNPDEVISHFEHEQKSNQRIHAQGFNVQASKPLREALVATMSKLDLSRQDDKTRFWVAVGQNFGLAKTEGMRNSVVAQDMITKVPAAFAAPLARIRDWLAKGQETEWTAEERSLFDTELRAATKAAGTAVTDKLIHGLVAVAEYQLAVGDGPLVLADTEGKTPFTTALSLEADGKTNGPLHALWHFTTGAFSGKWLRQIARGGVFLNHKTMTLNQWVNGSKTPKGEQGDGEDNYGSTGALADKKFQGLRAEVKELEDKGIQGIFEATARLAGFFLADNPLMQLKADRDEQTGEISLQITRGFAKNPYTITIYGSGRNGIAGKVAHEISKEFYTLLSTMISDLANGATDRDTQIDLRKSGRLQFYPEMLNDLALVTGERISRRVSKNKVIWESDTTTKSGKEPDYLDLSRSMNLGQLTNLSLGSGQMEMMRDNLLTVLINPLGDAIDAELGNVKATMSAIQGVTQAMGAFMQDRFKERVKALLDQKRADGTLNETDLLSRNDYNQIFRELAPYGAVITDADGESGDHLLLSGSEEVATERVQRGPNDEGFSNLVAPQPEDVGVGAAPLITISRSDAEMMVNYYAGEVAEELMAATPVFDGLEMALQHLSKISQAINKAQLDSLFKSPLSDVARSFRDWLSTQDVTGRKLKDVTDPLALLKMLNGLQNAVFAKAKMDGFVIEALEKLGDEHRELFYFLTEDEPGRSYTRIEDRLIKRLDGNVMGGMTGEEKNKNAKAFKKSPAYAALADVLREAVNEKIPQAAEHVEEMALQDQARKAVLESMGISGSHMASWEDVAFHEGEIIEVLDEDAVIKGDLAYGTDAYFDALAEKMNERARAEYLRLKGTKREAKASPVVQPENAALKAKLLGLKSVKPVEGTGLVRFSAELLQHGFTSTTASREARILVKALSNHLPKGFSVVVGSAEEIREWRKKVHRTQPRLDGNGEVVETKGEVDLQNKTIFLSNVAEETILHELWHAAADGVLGRAYFEGEGKANPLNEVQKKAFANLESLMDQFMELALEDRNSPEGQALATAQEEIRFHLGSGKLDSKLAAMQEFLAWTLTNQNLKNLGQRTRVKVKLIRIAHAALAGIRKLFGLPDGTPMDLFSSIQRNAAQLLHADGQDLEAAEARAKEAREVERSILAQLSPPGSNQLGGMSQSEIDRLDRMAKSFDEKVTDALNANGKPDVINQGIRDKLLVDAQSSLALFETAGFNFAPLQKELFLKIQMAMATGVELNRGALVRLETVFQHVLRNLDDQSFLPVILAGTGRDVSQAVASEKAQSTRLFEALTGTTGTVVDEQGRTSILPNFLALALIDSGLRQVLSGVTLNKVKSLRLGPNVAVDDWLESFGSSLMNELEIAVSGQGKGKFSDTNVASILDALAHGLLKTEASRGNRVEQVIDTATTRIQDIGQTGLDKAGDALKSGADKLTAMTSKMTGMRAEIRNGLASSLRVLGSNLKKDNKAPLNEVLVSLANGWNVPLVLQPLTKLLAELAGQTDSNAFVYALVNKGKGLVQKVRQDARVDVPDFLASQFKTKLPKETWEALTMVFAKTDLAALFDQFSLDDGIDLLTDPVNQTNLMTALKLEIERRAGKKFRADKMLELGDDLARSMMTGEVARGNNGLLRNAHAIALLVGHPGEARKVQGSQKGKLVFEEPDPELVKAIDQYVTLKAIEKLDPTHLNTVANLINSDREAIRILVRFTADLRLKELNRGAGRNGRMNAWKGYIPEETQEGVAFVVRPESDARTMAKLGYQRLGPYEGSGFESEPMAQYVSAVAGKAPFLQGALQTVEQSIGGVDPRLGITTALGRSGGVIMGQDLSDLERRRVLWTNNLRPGTLRNRHWQESGEPLKPVYDDQTGQLIAYERHIKPEFAAALKRNSQLHEMLGAWAGRQLEEQLSLDFNDRAIQELHAAYAADVAKGRAGEYVNIADKLFKDARVREAWQMMPRAVRAQAEAIYGARDTFWVRKDLVDNVVGYRVPSVAELWTGRGNINDQFRKTVTDFTRAVFGDQAFRNMVMAERGAQTVVSLAKNNIVVRSVRVAAANLAGNMGQLSIRGVPWTVILGSMPRKLAEVGRLEKNHRRITEIGILMARHAGNTVELERLEAEKKSLEDSSKRLSIHDLVEAGEFSPISDGLSEFDAAISTGTWAEKIDELANKVPERMGTLARYAVVSQSTALYKGLSRAVNYGDFLARSVLYDHYRGKGVSKEEALKRVRSEFVAYNILPGSVRSYADSLGMTPFWTYKIRMVSVAMNMLKTDPLRVLMLNAGSGFLPDVPGVNLGSAVEDNFLSQAVTGDLGRMTGWDWIWRAPGMNPWVSAL